MPLLRFRAGRPAERTIDTVLGVVDSDETFRGRVAAVLAADPHGVRVGAVGEGSPVEVEGGADPAGDDGTVDPVARLLVLRPPGWEEQWGALVAAAEAEDDLRRRERSELESVRRAEAVSARLDRQVAEIEELRSELAEQRRVVDEERADRARVVGRLGQLEAEVARARSERDRAVGELAATRRDLAEVHEELRALRRGEDPDRRAAQQRRIEVLGVARAAVADAASALAGVADELLVRVARDLTDLVEDLGADLSDSDDDGGVDVAPADEGAGVSPGVTTSGPEPRVARRRPLPLRRGVLDGDPDAVDQLLRTPGVVVLVDGYNLGMSVWRSLEPAALRERTVGFLTDVATRTGARIVVVFDGGEVGERLPVHTPLGVRTLYSPTGVEADDVLIDLVGEYPVEQPVVVVSSDRRVREGVRRGGANPVRSEELWAWSQDPGRS